MKTETRIAYVCDECNTELPDDAELCPEHPDAEISSIQIVENYD
jgi:RNA polymerase subunit RPABC4/transcription elongation factor Spt4